MGRTRILGFNPDRMKKQMLSIAVDEQNKRLVDFAEQKIRLLGDAIQLYNSRNHMDRTGNLLDSLCWCVCYDGNMVKNGFYREKRANSLSFLHGYTEVGFIEGNLRRKWKTAQSGLINNPYSYVDAGESVNGRERAEQYLAKAPKRCKSGQWMVMFAILAPYWGYWEEGHKNIFTKKFEQFSVMTQFYDKISAELKPAKTRIHVSVAKYASKSLVAQARKNLRHGTGSGIY